MCHFQVSSHCWWVPFCHRVPGRFRGLPLLLPRPVICHGPPYRSPHAAARSRVCHGSLYGLPLLLSPSPHSAMCHFQDSSHCWWVPFCHRGLYGLPIAAASTCQTVALHTLFGLVTAQMSEARSVR
ncbi:unnamed protein product [Staurois parvus]|uniref:Uncharacterized protein n=1 Tax=Staurois parvus TaxID=386267 RepID=A0ABN9DEL4_9NEOB|nr:unnamed protein product [Staurois parvus]